MTQEVNIPVKSNVIVSWAGRWAGAAALVALMMAMPAGAQIKIGVVDYGRLMEEAPQAKAALEAIRNEFTPRQRELQTQQTTLKTREEKLQKDVATMSPDQRSKAEKELRDAAREFQRKQAELQDDFNARRNEEMSRLQRTLIEEVRTYAKSQNYDLVVADGVIYATGSLDITSAILSGLKGNAKSSAAPAAAAPAQKNPGR
jgi:outer membrane protein